MQCIKGFLTQSFLKRTFAAAILLFAVSAFATQQKQTVTFTGAPASAAYQSTFTVTATSNSGETATITAAGPCTISGDTVTMTSGTGTCTLTASWPANTTYLAATATQKSIATKLKPTVTFTGAPAKAFALSTFNVTSTSNAGETATITATGACTVSGDNVTMTSGTGACSLKASWLTNANYLAATAAQTTTAEKLTQVVSFTGAPASAADLSSFSVTATSNSGESATITATGSCTVSSSTVSMTKGTGTCSLKASWATTADYLAATATQITTAAPDWVESELWVFGNLPDAADPWCNGLVFDKTGNLYGNTFFGGKFNKGAVFELTPNGQGGWNETIIHTFNPQSTSVADGSGPCGTLAIDSKGNIYGTTQGGGANGNGLVYELSPPTTAGGSWTETILYSFGTAASKDGIQPWAGVTLGNTTATILYGTTQCGGSGPAFNPAGAPSIQGCTNGSGTVYELSYNSTTKTWKESILYNFAANNAKDSAFPQGSLVLNGGKLYGVADSGGTGAYAIATFGYGAGTVFELETSGSEWTENVLYNFGATADDAAFPGFETPVFDSKKDIYGTSEIGGTFNGSGTAWELVYSAADNTYSEEVLYSFGAQNNDGCVPYWQLTPGTGKTSGAWFGTTSSCGENSLGTFFELNFSATTGWKETIIHQFTGGNDGANGFYPGAAQVIVDKNGNPYGMTSAGGPATNGNVFEFTPIE